MGSASSNTEGYKRKNISKTKWKEFTYKIIFVFTPGNRDILTIVSTTDLAYKIISEYVQNTIVKRNGLQEQAFAQTSNSFQFFYLYNQAAVADVKSPPLFLSKAIRFLQLPECKYIR